MSIISKAKEAIELTSLQSELILPKKTKKEIFKKKAPKI
jgi:hypothetical protein